jgi:uncharacterized protein (DUF305 family)
MEAFMKLSTLLAASAITVLPALVIAQDNAAKEAFTEVHHKMMADMEKLQATGNADKDFVTMMIPHHQGAIDMAKVQLEHGKDEKLRAMAQKMIDDQQKEIEEMQAWLAANQ